MIRMFTLLGLVVAGPAVLHAQAQHDLVARAVQVMGGEAALRGLRSVSAEYHVATFGLGQSETPESPPRAGVAFGRVVTDLQANRRTRSQELRPVAGAPSRNRRVTAGGIGMLEIPAAPSMNPDAPGTVVAVERQMRREPERLLVTALDNPAALSALPARAFRGEQHDGVRFALGPDTVNLYFDRYSGLLTVMETIADDPILGDRRTAAMYTRWQNAGPVRFARQIDVTANGQPIEHWIFTNVTADAPITDSAFAIPDSVARRAQRSSSFAPSPVNVTMVELAPGLWRAEGSTHHSLVVEQPDHVVVVEAPQSTARMSAVLDTLRSRFPAKRVGLVVNTHHHWDHAGGLRPVIGAGIPIVTHARNAAFIRQIAAAPRTVQPDEQSRRRRPPEIRTMDDSVVIGEGASQVVVYNIPSAHVEGIVAAYVPSARVLFAADVLNPAPVLSQPGSAELVAFARARGLAPARYAGAHGAVLDWTAVERAAAGAR
ncbi:MAG: MBL fold metallo-hydrolase [Gemmatimonadota bacterium]